MWGLGVEMQSGGGRLLSNIWVVLITSMVLMLTAPALPSQSAGIDYSALTLWRTLTGHVELIRSVVFFPNGSMIASCSQDRTVRIWDVSTGALKKTLTGHSDVVRAVAVSPDGMTLASASDDKTVKVWDVQTGTLKRTINQGDRAYSVAFSPDGKTVASGSADYTVKLWDVQTGMLKRTLSGHGNLVYPVAFSPDGKTVASGSYDNTVKLWDAQTGTLKRTLSGHGSFVYSVAFSPDGKTVVSGSNDRTVKLWDAQTGGLNRTLSGHNNFVHSAVFSPDGHTVVSGSKDETIKIWDVQTGALTLTLTGDTKDVYGVAFSPDGRVLANGSGDKTIKFWRVPSGLPTGSSSVFASGLMPLVRRYCTRCHGSEVQSNQINFEAFVDTAAVRESEDVWNRAASKLRSGRMPPQAMPQPTVAERSLMISIIDTTLSTMDEGLPDPGRVTMRRLNRAEYNNTIRDLLRIGFNPADNFPSDDVGYGFDNIGDVLSISSLLMEKYLAVAEKIAETAIFAEDAREPVHRFYPDDIPTTEKSDVTFYRVRLRGNGEIGVVVQFPRDGTYILRARAYAQQAGSEPARMALRLDDRQVREVDVTADEVEPEIYAASVKVKTGERRFAVAFINDYYNPDDPDSGNRDRNLLINYLEVAGPLAVKPDPLPASHRRILPRKPLKMTQDAYVEKVIRDLAERAFRRPVTNGEVSRLLRHVQMAQDEGDSLERGIQIALQAILISPHFLFRVELDSEPDDPNAVRELNDYELASRLSYFIWSSMPDEELFELAKRGVLHKPSVLEVQVRRMLKDRKSNALVENFASQWLALRNLNEARPDPSLFPDFDDDLRAAMRKETELFFEDVLREDRDLIDFIDGRFTFLNERLAQHYGIRGVTGTHFRRVKLKGNQRGGVLTHASVLTLTSTPTRTSPVKRGKWILEQILGEAPPPPLPGVAELKEQGDAMLTLTLRQRMEQHRRDPACAPCHSTMDPIGYAFEKYDAIGQWRTHEGKFLIDTSGQFPDGRSFKGPSQLKTILKRHYRQFVRCLTEKMLTYALGRGLEYYDERAVDRIVDVIMKKETKMSVVGQTKHDVTKRKNRLSNLVFEIVKSEPFNKRRGEGDRQ